jgi:ABC-type nickel/cobalt efflux system permease component RcnA
MLALGMLVGIRHALEADHLAAVAALASRSASLAQRITVAAVWGCGHALSLTVLGGLLLALGTALSEPVARGFELVAALLLIAVGIDVVRRARRQGLHVHAHEHAGGARHLHLHAHAGDARHDPAAHEHDHADVRRLLPRALAVGGVHGLAGSGALVALSMQSLGSGFGAFAYVVCFAVGSIVGMMAFSVGLSVPLALSGRAVRTAGGVERVFGAVSIVVGCWMAVHVVA